MKRNRAERLRPITCWLVPLASAFVPIALGWHTALGLDAQPLKDAPYRAQALGPLLGVASVIAYAVGARNWKPVIPMIPFLAVAGWNAAVWTKVVAWNPCSGDNPCPDIGDGLLIALGLFVSSVGLPLTALIGGAISLTVPVDPNE